MNRSMQNRRSYMQRRNRDSTSTLRGAVAKAEVAATRKKGAGISNYPLNRELEKYEST